MKKIFQAVLVVAVFAVPAATVHASSELSVSTGGRNIARGQNVERASVIGRGSETIEILIHVRNATTRTLYGTEVTDILPVGLRYLPQTTAIDGFLAADGIARSGLPIGTLAPSQEKIVRFSVLVDPATVPAWGQVELPDTAYVRADGVAAVVVRLPVILGNNTSIAAISRVKTGPGDSLFLSLLLALVVTACYARYTDTKFFNQRFALARIQRHAARRQQTNFLR